MLSLDMNSIKPRSIWIGYEPSDLASFVVTRSTVEQRLSEHVPIRGLVLDDLKRRGLFWRPTETRINRETMEIEIWDLISDAPNSTEFSISRFLVPHLAGRGWALFMDSDMVARADLAELFAMADDRYAVMCVKHQHQTSDTVKMNGKTQTWYSRKNWSSLMLFNCDHPANQALTVSLVNEVPGRDLHRFCWLGDDLIGALPEEWNWLAGWSSDDVVPKIIHHTNGSPSLPEFADIPTGDEWRAELERWALGAPC